MIYTLLKKAIEQKNLFMTSDMLSLQVEFFHTAGKITDAERAELVTLLTGPVEEV